VFRHELTNESLYNLLSAKSYCKVTVPPPLPQKVQLPFINCPSFLGLEFEFEKTNLTPNIWETAYKNLVKARVSDEKDNDSESCIRLWRAVADHSLRGEDAIELISRHPMTLDVLSKGLDVLELMCKSWAASYRTGTHVHLHVLDLELVELKNLLSLYCLLEPAIYTCAGDERGGNPFCAPFYKRSRAPADIASGMATYHGLWALATTSHKYSGLNLRPVRDKGTVEFRHIRTTKDKKAWINWVNLILAIKYASLKPDFRGMFEKTLRVGDYTSLINWMYEGTGVAPHPGMLYDSMHKEIDVMSHQYAAEIWYSTNLYAKQSKPNPKKTLEQERENAEALFLADQADRDIFYRPQRAQTMVNVEYLAINIDDPRV
jgi:hypothetical protein